MKTIEEKILKLKDKRSKLQYKVAVLDSKLDALKNKCKHPTTKKVMYPHGSYGIACLICNKTLENH